MCRTFANRGAPTAWADIASGHEATTLRPGPKWHTLRRRRRRRHARLQRDIITSRPVAPRTPASPMCPRLRRRLNSPDTCRVRPSLHAVAPSFYNIIVQACKSTVPPVNERPPLSCTNRRTTLPTDNIMDFGPYAVVIVSPPRIFMGKKK